MGETTSAGRPVVEIRDLRLHYFTSRGPVRALDGVSFDLRPGETLGLVGESGCGKTTAGLALLGMVPPPGRIVSGSIRIGGREIVGMPDPVLRRDLRWSEISMVFQGAMNCLTPVYTVRELMAETFREHRGRAEAGAGGWEASPRRPAGGSSEGGLEALMGKYLELVGLPRSVLGRYPHELSGGMKQRVVIALALFLEPKVVVLDEPTTALDVIVQAQILNLLKALRRDLGLSYVFITHDLAAEAEIADRIMVLYAGKVAEIGPAEDIFGGPEAEGEGRQGGSRSESPSGPLHPYTQALLASTPRLRSRANELAFIPGAPPDLLSPPPGCRFAPRCPYAKPKCRAAEPPLASAAEGRLAACWKAAKDAEYGRG